MVQAALNLDAFGPSTFSSSVLLAAPAYPAPPPAVRLVPRRGRCMEEASRGCGDTNAGDPSVVCREEECSRSDGTTSAAVDAGCNRAVGAEVGKWWAGALVAVVVCGTFNGYVAYA